MIIKIILLMLGAVFISFVIRKVWVSKWLFGSFWDKFSSKDDTVNRDVVIAPLVSSFLIAWVVYEFMLRFDDPAQSLVLVGLLGVASFLLSFQCFLLSGREYKYYLNHYAQVFVLIGLLFCLIYFQTIYGIDKWVIILVSSAVTFIFTYVWHTNKVFKGLWEKFNTAPNKGGDFRLVYAPLVGALLIAILLYYLITTYSADATLLKTIYFVLSYIFVSAMLSFHCFLKTGKSYIFLFNHYTQVSIAVILMTIFLKVFI